MNDEPNPDAFTLQLDGDIMAQLQAAGWKHPAQHAKEIAAITAERDRAVRTRDAVAETVVEYAGHVSRLKAERDRLQEWSHTLMLLVPEDYEAPMVSGLVEPDHVELIVDTVWSLAVARREGICGDEGSGRFVNCAETFPVICVLSHGHLSSWHEADNGTTRWRKRKPKDATDG